MLAIHCLALKDWTRSKHDASTGDLLRGRDHLRGSGDDVLAALVRCPAFENDAMAVLDLLRDFDRDGDGVAEHYRPKKMQRLIGIDVSGAGKLCPEDGRDQRCAPHAVCHDLVEHVALGKGLVHMRGIDVSRHDREHLDVFVSERADEARCVSRLEFIEGLVFDALHGTPPSFNYPTIW